MNPRDCYAGYNEWQRKRHLTPTQPPPSQPPPLPKPYLLSGGPLAAVTVFLASPGTLPIRWRGMTGRYAGDRGSTSLEWTVITARRGWWSLLYNRG